MFGKQGYVYFGNSKDDLYVWKYALSAVVVSKNKKLIEKAKQISNVVLII